MGREEAKFRFCTGLNFLDPVIGDNFLLTLFFFGGDDEKVVTSDNGSDNDNCDDDMRSRKLVAKIEMILPSLEI